MRRLIGVGLVTILAFVVRFVLPLPFALLIHTHDNTYRVVPLRVLSFWVLLVIAAAWLVIAASRLLDGSLHQNQRRR